MSEAEITAIKSCQAGDRQAFGQLYDQYIKKIYAFVYAKTGHRETAEDLVSQTFFKALDSIDKFKFDGQGTFQSWLYTIARNLIIDNYRRQKNDIDINDCWDLAGKENSAIDFDAKEKIFEIKKYLSKLKPEQREIIIMRIWQEMSYAEIAEATEKSEAACKMTFSRAMKELRQAMPLAIWIALVAGLLR